MAIKALIMHVTLSSTHNFQILATHVKRTNSCGHTEECHFQHNSPVNTSKTLSCFSHLASTTHPKTENWPSSNERPPSPDCAWKRSHTCLLGGAKVLTDTNDWTVRITISKWPPWVTKTSGSASLHYKRQHSIATTRHAPHTTTIPRTRFRHLAPATSSCERGVRSPNRMPRGTRV